MTPLIFGIDEVKSHGKYKFQISSIIENITKLSYLLNHFSWEESFWASKRPSLAFYAQQKSIYVIWMGTSLKCLWAQVHALHTYLLFADSVHNMLTTWSTKNTTSKCRLQRSTFNSILPSWMVSFHVLCLVPPKIIHQYEQSMLFATLIHVYIPPKYRNIGWVKVRPAW